MKRLTIEQTEAIRERAEKATEGPWTYTDASVKSKHAKSYYWGGKTNDVCSLNDGEYIENQNAELDAEFIANARQDIPALLAEVDRLRKLALDLLNEYDHTERHYISGIGDYRNQIAMHEKYIEYYKAKINGKVDE